MVTVVHSPGLAVAGPKICFISQTVDIIHPDATRACSIVRVGQWYHDTPVNKWCDLPISAKWEESKDVLENYSHGFLLKIFSYCENNWHSNSPSDDHYMDGADTYVGLFRALHTTVASGIPQPSSQTVPHWLLWKTSTLPLFEVPFTRRTFIVSIWPTNGNVKPLQSVEWIIPMCTVQGLSSMKFCIVLFVPLTGLTSYAYVFSVITVVSSPRIVATQSDRGFSARTVGSVQPDRTIVSVGGFVGSGRDSHSLNAEIPWNNNQPPLRRLDGQEIAHQIFRTF